MAKENKAEAEEKTEENKQPGLAIIRQFAKDFSLEIPHAPEIFGEIQEAPEVALNVETKTRPLAGGTHLSSTVYHLEGKAGGKALFIVELEYCAEVALNVPEEHVEPVLVAEVPRIVFPFARSIIANAMSDAGLQPLLLSPIDFSRMYMAKKGS